MNMIGTDNCSNRGSRREFPKPMQKNKGWPWSEDSIKEPLSISDKKEYPRISIVTPSFNQGEFIEETIRSVLLQNYPNLQYIIVDGGSSDSTIEIIKRYSPWISYWISEHDEGQSDAINKGMILADGDICAWLNSDDVLTKDALYIVGKYFNINSACMWLGGSGQLSFIGSGKKGVMKSSLSNTSILIDFWKFGKVDGCFLFQPSIFWKKSLWDKVGGLSEDYHFAMDYDLWLKFSEHTKLYSISNILSIAKRYDDCKTVGQRKAQCEELMDCSYSFVRSSGKSGLLLTVRMLVWFIMRDIRLAKYELVDKNFINTILVVFNIILLPVVMFSKKGRLSLLE